MVKLADNKYKYWMVTLQIQETLQEDGTYKKYLPSEIEILSTFKEMCEDYVFQKELTKEGKPHFQCALKLKIRKRMLTILNELSDSFNYSNESGIQLDRMHGTWEQAMLYCSKKDSRAEESATYFSNNLLEPYKGSDIDFLNDVDRRYPWQDELFSLLYKDPPFILQNPNDRDIIWITDEQGNTGKSKFVKYCYFHNKEQTTKISFGSASQLRSAVISAGPKKLYFIDIPRTLGVDDAINNIISVIEDIKNGYLSSSFYGESKTLLMEPPHIVVFTNMICPQDKLSTDRWNIYYLINKELRSF